MGHQKSAITVSELRAGWVRWGRDKAGKCLAVTPRAVQSAHVFLLGLIQLKKNKAKLSLA